MSVAIFLVLLFAGGAAALAPLLRRPVAWPADPPDQRDDVARSVSSLRDLEFARAAGTIAAIDYTRLRATLERDAFMRPAAERAATAPVRTVLVAALVVAVVAVAAAFYLPREAGDRAPGEPITGTVPQTTDVTALESRAKDMPAQLALADAYVQAGRVTEASVVYRAVLAKDPQNIAALDGIGLILVASGSNDGAIAATDLVLAQRPRDPDALFVKGLALYRKEDWKGAVDVWTIYLDVGKYHSASDMVRTLYADAKVKAGS